MPIESPDRTATFTRLISLLLALGVASPAAATLSEEDASFQVNQYTTRDQKASSVAVRPDGSFLITWNSGGSAVPDGGRNSVQARLFASDGSPVADQLQLHETTSGHKGTPEAAARDDGTFVVIWSGQTEGRLVDSDGSVLGGEFVVQDSAYGLGEKDIAVSSDGGFVVVWTVDNVRARRMDASGAPLGDVFEVAPALPPEPINVGVHSPQVALEQDGDFLILWAEARALTKELVQARAYSSSGAPLGGEFDIVGIPGFEAEIEAVGLAPADGGFVAVWAAQRPGDPDGTLEARSVTLDGDLGPIFTVEEAGAESLKLAPTSLGLALTWVSDETVFLREMRLDGSPFNDAVVVAVDPGPEGYVQEPVVGGDGAGGVVVVWTEESPLFDGGEAGVLARRYVLGCSDVDGDGFFAEGDVCGTAGDCDDGNAAINPDAAEIPGNGLDDDCDPGTPTGCQPQL